MKDTSPVANMETTSNALYSVTQSEIDLFFYLQEATRLIEDKGTKEKLIDFQKKCEKNIGVLAALTQEYGKETPTFTKGLQGKMAEKYLDFRSLTGERSVLKTLHTHLQNIAKTYEQIVDSNLPDEAKNVVQVVHSDVQKSLAFINSKILA